LFEEFLPTKKMRVVLKRRDPKPQGLFVLRKGVTIFLSVGRVLVRYSTEPLYPIRSLRPSNEKNTHDFRQNFFTIVKRIIGVMCHWFVLSIRDSDKPDVRAQARQIP
jgi:hypothetical protein